MFLGQIFSVIKQMLRALFGYQSLLSKFTENLNVNFIMLYNGDILGRLSWAVPRRGAVAK